MTDTTQHQTQQQQIQQLAMRLAAEQDATAKAALKAELRQLAAAELEAAQAAEAGAPLYPAGAVATIEGKTATVRCATLSAAGWAYEVEIDAGALIPNFSVTKTEAELKTLLAEQINQTPGPAYFPGMTVHRHGQGGEITAVDQVGETYRYTVRGWPAPVTERELAGILARA